MRPEAQIPEDTTPEAWAVYQQALANLSPEQKFKTTMELAELAVRLSEAGQRALYPQASDREIFLRAARVRLGNDLFERVYGPCLEDNV